MHQSLFFGLSALIALVPAALVSWRPEPARDGVFWSVIAVAIAGPGLWVFVQTTGTAWRTGLAPALWVTVAASTVAFAGLAAFSREGWRLVALFAPYMLIVAILALIWQHQPGHPIRDDAPVTWVHMHIFFAVTTYALVTLAAVSALAAFLQDKALKNRQPTRLTRLLPSLADCETLTLRLLLIGAGILAAGLATGMATQYAETGRLLQADHKTILSLTAFVVILGLLLAHHISGLRGRSAARFVLLAYLLMTLGYPGVKFVTDILLR
ncbi:MAG: cytochrome c biogenesis protein CcsA [Rhodospirillales bacterium]